MSRSGNRTVIILVSVAIALTLLVVFMVGRGQNQSKGQVQLPANHPNLQMTGQNPAPAVTPSAPPKSDPSTPVNADSFGGKFLGEEKDSAPRDWPYPYIGGAIKNEGKADTKAAYEGSMLLENYLKSNYAQLKVNQTLWENNDSLGYQGLRENNLRVLQEWREITINTIRHRTETGEDVITDAYLYYVVVTNTKYGTQDEALLVLLYRRPGEGWKAQFKQIQ